MELKEMQWKGEGREWVVRVGGGRGEWMEMGW